MNDQRIVRLHEIAYLEYDVLPDDALYERRISSANTFDYWIKAHRWDTLWHQRFGPGYCHKCQKEASA